MGLNMDYKYDVVNYNKNIPATIMRLKMTSDTQKTELQWHREPEIIYVVKGRSECSHNGEIKIIEEHDFLMLNSEDVHLVRPVSIKILNKLNTVDENEDYNALLQIAYINKLYYLLLNNCICFRRASASVNMPKRDFSYAKTAIAYINENYKHEIPLDEISAVVNLSPSYFSKYFKSVTQVSFSEYLANLRLENAIQDMLNDNATVSSAAIENGFANVKSFITQCKKVYNCTPAQYKKRLLNKQ